MFELGTAMLKHVAGGQQAPSTSTSGNTTTLTCPAGTTPMVVVFGPTGDSGGGVTVTCIPDSRSHS